MTLSENPTIAVIGSGAVGLYYGGRLARSGLPVHFLARSGYDTLRTRGLRAHSCHGDFVIPPGQLQVYRSPSHMPPADIVLVALKTTANDRLAYFIRPLLKSNTTIITLQNGLGNEDAIAEIVGRERVLGGIAFTCINRLPDGAVHHSSHGLIRLGSFYQPNPNLHPIAALFSAAQIHCQPIPDLIKGRWQKLIWNVPFNGLGAALDLATDQLLSTPAGTKLVTALMHEIMSASAALGMPFDDPDAIVAHQLAETREMARYHTSMQLDRRHNRPLEHEAIVGEPLRRGTAAGVAMPQTAHLYDLLCAVSPPPYDRRLPFATGVAVSGSSGHECFGYCARKSFLT